LPNGVFVPNDITNTPFHVNNVYAEAVHKSFLPGAILGIVLGLITWSIDLGFITTFLGIVIWQLMTEWDSKKANSFNSSRV
jgi:hypothetical protein